MIPAGDVTTSAVIVPGFRGIARVSMGGKTTGDEGLRQPTGGVPGYRPLDRGQTGYTVSTFSHTGAGKNTSKFKLRNKKQWETAESERERERKGQREVGRDRRIRENGQEAGKARRDRSRSRHRDRHRDRHRPGHKDRHREQI
jgi:hypothetical protein